MCVLSFPGGKSNSIRRQGSLQERDRTKRQTVHEGKTINNNNNKRKKKPDYYTHHITIVIAQNVYRVFRFEKQFEQLFLDEEGGGANHNHTHTFVYRKRPVNPIG